MSELTFEPPGPGTWQLNDDHFSKPLSRYQRDLPLGINSKRAVRARAKYGYLVETKAATVNGFHYLSRQPVEGASNFEANTANLGEIATAPETEFERRILNAKETFETKRWRADLERWDTEWKPAIRETHRCLQAVDPAVLDTDDLIDHLDDCRNAVIEHGGLSFAIILCGIIPRADFFALVREHSDVDAVDVASLFGESGSHSQAEFGDTQKLADAIEADTNAREILFSNHLPEEIIEQLIDLPGDVGSAAEQWVADVGYRISTGYGLSGNYALERPETLVNTLQSAVKGDGDEHSTPDVAERLDEIRQMIPPGKRDTFQSRYEEARLTYRVPDERSLLTAVTSGLLRRALLEAGQRLAERGRLRERDHVLELQHEELVAALRGQPAPSAGEVAIHAQYREQYDASDAPDRLGPEPSGSIPQDSLPDAAERFMKAGDAWRWVDESGASNADDGEDVVQGHAASEGTVEGSARLVDGPDDLDRIEDGDILVTEITSPAFNIVLSMVGGIVTDTGGMLSHPAIVAREFGIPGVVGCEDATERIQDGDRIVVDGSEGTVRSIE